MKTFRKRPNQIKQNHILQDHFYQVFSIFYPVLIRLSNRFELFKLDLIFGQHFQSEHPKDKTNLQDCAFSKYQNQLQFYRF